MPNDEIKKRIINEVSEQIKKADQFRIEYTKTMEKAKEIFANMVLKDL